MRNIMGRLFAQHRVFLILVALLLAVFQFILCAIVASLNITSALEQILMFAPPVMRAAIEQTMLGGSDAGVLAFGWNHPITHALLTAVAITLGSRAVAGEIESGAIELVLAQPISRARYLLAHLLFGISAIAIVAVAGVLGTAVGQHIFHLKLFAPARLLELLSNVVLLQVALLGIALLLSSFGREAGKVAVLTVWLALVSYFINVVATLWSKAAFIQPYSLHSYFDPRKILVNGVLPRLSIAVLASFAILCTAGAFARLKTRDLP